VTPRWISSLVFLLDEAQLFAAAGRCDLAGARLLMPFPNSSILRRSWLGRGVQRRLLCDPGCRRSRPAGKP